MDIPKSDWFQLATMFWLFMGTLTLGLAVGFAISLNLLQSAAIAEGVFPPPGAPVGPVGAFERPDGPLWDVAKRMQSYANGFGVLGALLLLGGGVLDSYGGRIAEVFD